jgi:hypothetical protein
MPDDRVEGEPYEAPRIAERADIALPLIGGSVNVCPAFAQN